MDNHRCSALRLRNAARVRLILLTFLTGCGLVVARPASGASQFLVFNASPGVESNAFHYVRNHFKPEENDRVRVGVGRIFSYLHHPREQVVKDLESFLKQSETLNVPIVVQLDGEQWWGNRPDLWNWWDAARPGFSPSNRLNVEWTDWSSESAIQIAWRNWGRQLRVLPPPNLMSPRYRTACHEEMRVLVPFVLDWWKALPEERKELLVGISRPILQGIRQTLEGMR